MIFSVYKKILFVLNILGFINLAVLLSRLVFKAYALGDNPLISSLYTFSEGLILPYKLFLTDIPLIGASILDIPALVALSISIFLASITNKRSFSSNKLISKVITRRRMFAFSKKLKNNFILPKQKNVITKPYKLDIKSLEEKYHKLLFKREIIEAINRI